MKHVIYRCKGKRGCGRVIRMTYLSTVSWLRCPDCNRYMTGEIVKGQIRPEIKCGGKCRSSVGPACECSCGGENHGMAYSIGGKDEGV